MQVTILGSGTATPSFERNSSGLFIQTAKTKALLDMGPGTLRRMCEAHIDYKEIDVITLTHFHPDHVTDFISFLFASNYAYGPMRTAPFHVIGPTGLEQLYLSLVEIFGNWIVPSGNRMLMHEMSATAPDSYEINGLQVSTRPAAHSFPSLSYRIDAEETALTISGDTDVSENLIELARNSDTLVCECSMPDNMKINGHMTPSEAGSVATAAMVKRLILTHFYPPCDDVDVVSAAQNKFHGTVLKAEDLMTVDLNV
ncbi:MAG: MBL fold metallo-hydrolase [Deltaproteobacteria bacterium]|nr:MBL fold metallo-hydrolase [Deltaproteobacteria bacterium]